MKKGTTFWGICLSSIMSSLYELTRCWTPFPGMDVTTEWRIILISEMGAVHCEIKQKLVWNLFDKNVKVFSSLFLMVCRHHTLHPSLPSLSFPLSFLWDAVPLSHSFTNLSLPSVVPPNILSCNITFDMGVRLDHLMLCSPLFFPSSSNLPPFYHLTWQISRILRAIYVDIFIY